MDVEAGEGGWSRDWQLRAAVQGGHWKTSFVGENGDAQLSHSSGLSAGLQVHTQPFALRFYSFSILSVK